MKIFISIFAIIQFFALLIIITSNMIIPVWVVLFIATTLIPTFTLFAILHNDSYYHYKHKHGKKLQELGKAEAEYKEAKKAMNVVASLLGDLFIKKKEDY